MFNVILSHAVKYLTGSAIASIVTLCMTKYYTFVFSPTDFGVLSLYIVMLKYVVSLVSLNLDSSSTRLYFDYNKNGKRDEYLSTIFWIITFMALVVLVVGICFMVPVSNLIYKDSEVIYLITLIAGIGAVYVNFLMRVLYNENRSTSVLKHTVFQTLVNHFFSIIFISIFGLGIIGRVSGQGLGYVLNIITLFKEFSKQNLFKIKIVFNGAMAKETFMLTLPSMISMFLGVTFVYIDRFFLKYYIGDNAVGVYTLGYFLGQGLSMIVDAISQAILPKVYNDMNDNYKKSIKELECFSYKYYIGLVVITMAISLLSPVIVAIFSNNNYTEASTVMPFIMVGFMMGGFYKIPSLVLGFHKIVWFFPFLAIFSFVLNAILNFYLVPICGMIGSAFASFLGAFFYSSYLQYKASIYFTARNNGLTFLLYILILIIVLGVFYGQNFA